MGNGQSTLRIVAVSRYTVRDQPRTAGDFYQAFTIAAMYQPKHFAIKDTGQMVQLIAAHPLATLIASATNPVQVNHIPMLVADENADQLVLQCHVARANPLWSALEKAPDVIAVFCGVQSYISPNWYASKAEHGKVVPTWNYEAVHAHGNATIQDDPQWMRGFLDRLTDTHEAFERKPWQVGDAPDDYLKKMIGAVVGIEITVTKLEGKAKLSQNQPEINLATINHNLSHASHSDEMVRTNRHEMATRMPKK